MSKTLCLRRIQRPRSTPARLPGTRAARWLGIASLVACGAIQACAQPSAPLPTTAPPTTPSGPTHAFQQPSAEATRDAVQGVWIVGAIAAAGVLAIFVGAWYFYAPKAWQRPDRPTPQPARSPLEQAELADAYERKDRFDLEGELGDFIEREKRPPGE